MTIKINARKEIITAQRIAPIGMTNSGCPLASYLLDGCIYSTISNVTL